MKNLMYYLFFLVFTYTAIGQSSVTPLVKAENDFEKACFEKGIKQGFLDNLDTSAIAFTDKGIVSALQFWNSLSDFKGIYSWAPSYAEVSLSGDWGYTTGSVEFREKSMQDTPAYYSQYTTIWHKTTDGRWKYLVDIGNRHGSKMIDRNVKAINIPKFRTDIKEDSISDLEKKYIKALLLLGINGVANYYSDQYILNMNGQFPVLDKATAIDQLTTPMTSLDFKPEGFKIAPSGDMAVAYGYVTYKGVPNNYVRVWRHERNGWKIALEVIKF